MAGNAGGFEDDPLVPGSYSELLFGDDISGLETNGIFGFTNDDADNDEKNISTPKMLCFGDYAKQSTVKMAAESSKKTGRNIRPACKDSPLTISSKKRNGSGNQNAGSNSGAPTASQKNSKKQKSDSSNVSGHAKTDTASVLHEASGYIRFLHDQVQVLCSPYLQRLPTTMEEPPHPENGDLKEWEMKKKLSNLRSRGLCLVPIELTLNVAEESNGADLWSSVDRVLTG
ncbi:basic helix-loop-helix (bHLH) DNA-bindingsuperfamily protein [Striga asiatica]|uniref:Basic helix-loop-helix (BHLH) DNA-bindingsuperfamily protein n=1 Tax=Striga asiatica TaxID=4170 RepID=A0A5A7P894_STRAF|nr:basic helix-loop-helix (bHLH) DNA-bindingsuperfamily protein [Striga asiatica]